MKIAIVLNTSWNIYNFRKGLVEALLENGHKVVTIAPHDKYSDLLTQIGCEHFNVRMDSRGVNPIKDLLLILELYLKYKRAKPDVILHYTIKPNIYGTIAASLLGIPVINNVCGLGTAFLDKNFASRIAIQLYRFAFRFPKKIFFQNHDDMVLFRRKKMVKKGICDVLPGSGIDLNKFTPMNKKKKEKFTFLLISRLIYDKGVIEYIDAVKELKEKGIDAKFQILGAIDEKHRRGIPRKIIDHWLKEGVIEYLGTTGDVRYAISNSDCVVLPSYREGTPRTLLEAASMSKPLIATNVPGCNNVVKDNYNGFLCRLKDSKDLAQKMEKLLHMPEEQIRAFGQNSRKEVEQKFDERYVINAYLNSIKAIK